MTSEQNGCCWTPTLKRCQICKPIRRERSRFVSCRRLGVFDLVQTKEKSLMPARRGSSLEDEIQWPRVSYYLKWDNRKRTKQHLAEERRGRRCYYQSAEYRKRLAAGERFHEWMADGRRRLSGWWRRRR